jgi:broad specificity phosphatase PhoE
VRRVLLARHGESDLSVSSIVNGDPAVECGLTAEGERQARDLGRALAHEPIELCVTSDFRRCLGTARIALGGRSVRSLETSTLGDIRAGLYEGGRTRRLSPLGAHGTRRRARPWRW